MRTRNLATTAALLLLPLVAPGCSSTECTGPGPVPEVGTRESIPVAVDATGAHTGTVTFAMRSWTFPAGRILTARPSTKPVVVRARLIGGQRARFTTGTGTWTQGSDGFVVGDEVCM